MKLLLRTSGLLPAPAGWQPSNITRMMSRLGSVHGNTLPASAQKNTTRQATYGKCYRIATARRMLVHAAVFSPDTAADEVSESTLAVGSYSVKVKVMKTPSEQRVHMETTATTKMLLHWGLEGGKDYKGGWRLPGEACRPPNTIQYKDRALQTRFLQEGAHQTLEIILAGDEVSDNLNFVFKEDGGTDRWYDCNGTNFVVSLNPLEAITKMTMTGKPAPEGPLPELSNELCGIWAYIKWEEAGCPNRSQEESDREYRQGIIEMQELLQQGITMDELWKVAKGEILYPEFMRSIGSLDTVDLAPQVPETKPVQDTKQEIDQHVDDAAANLQASAAEPEQAEILPTIPHDLVICKAYMMWVENGRPMGANFDDAARSVLEEQLSKGRTLDSLMDEVYSAKQAQDKLDQEAAARRAAEEAERAKEAAARAMEEEKRAKEEAAARARDEAKESVKSPASVSEFSSIGSQEIGQAFVHQQNRNPMDFIKDSDVPLLSADKDKKQVSALEPLVQAAALDESVVYRRLYPMGNQTSLLAVVTQLEKDGEVVIDLTTDVADDVVLHWGVSPIGDRNGWVQPAEALLPDEDSICIKNGIAAETPFSGCDEDECDVEVGGYKVPLQRVKIQLPPSHGLAGLQFVVRSEDSTRWWKDGNGNYKVRVPGSGQAIVSSIEEDFIDNEVALQIVQAESSSMWTLMHRYNKVADLLEGLLAGRFSKADPVDATAHLYVWLRYSSNRHITWQRNYNTQPRILSAAQDRLTRTIANTHKATAGEAQEWVRLMLGMLGRGGDGQKIRDEILNIMHRNGIKEVRGTWMEEWHQKLHNNTTPDDIGICEAYLAFLRANGDNGVYWRVLSDHGISRARLESFDRAIRCEPEDYPHMRGTLIGEFENYLAILKAVHSGTDLQTSAQAAAYCTPEAAKGFLGYVLSNRNGQVVPLLEAAVEARTEIRKAAIGNRELMYLDLALEDVIRGGAERAAGASPNNAIRLVGPLLQNLCLTAGDNEEICFCLAAWLALPEDLRQGHHPSREDALQAAAVVDRTRIALANISDTVSSRIEPIATALGNSFGVEEWATVLFAEEVVRGGPAFAVSQVLGNIEAGLRSAAELGAWQVISPGGSTGRIRVEHDLYKIQDEIYDEPTVLVIDRVTGEEEIPEGAVAVLTPDAPDVLSHVSVRARNMHVLFATCHDDGPLEQLRSMNGRVIDVKTSAAGDVTWTEADDLAFSADIHDPNSIAKGNLKIDVPRWIGKYAVGMDEFKDGVVGAKSKNIAGLRGKLPDWIKLPASVTIPFGSFEQALDERECTEVKHQLDNAVQRIKESPAEVLQECRNIIMSMTVPEKLKTQLSQEMTAAGMEWPDGQERWDEALEALKGVWASKFNERAYISMRKAGLPFMDLRMAVLVMRVVPAQYAFVIHTMNPSTRDSTEVYCELVTGLGETLVSGQFPGKSMAFSASKSDPENPRVLSYPSKSAAMFVPESLIFRSDSNGEDLEGYAGAGLYDSITMDPCVTRRIDYTGDRLIMDEGFRRHILSQICKVGIAIEEALGDPQDVEGVVDPDGNIFVVQTRPQV